MSGGGEGRDPGLKHRVNHNGIAAHVALATSADWLSHCNSSRSTTMGAKLGGRRHNAQRQAPPLAMKSAEVKKEKSIPGLWYLNLVYRPSVIR